jgi:succinate-semialdehyde dehydrogenase/glutarate-semialdehyde dehydrogenase
LWAGGLKALMFKGGFMRYQTINPYTNKLEKEYEIISDEELSFKLSKANEEFLKWRKLEVKDRTQIIKSVSELLKSEAAKHANLITLEMGKPITQSYAEIEKCGWLCDYYIENAEDFLKPEVKRSRAKKSYLTYDPIGILYAIMPWNFPYWQVFRYLVPNLIAGNVSVLKHAPNVPQCSNAIEDLFKRAGLPEFVFQNLFIDYNQSEKVIENEHVWGVTITGSGVAGSKVAEQAGRNIKKSVLELGGSDPFIVFPDADIDAAVEAGVIARMQNTGQSCIAAKRFIIHKDIKEKFLEKYCAAVEDLKIGNPFEESTYIGPIAKGYLLENLDSQVERSIELGAKVVIGGKKSDFGNLYYQPTVLTGIKKGMPAYNEEFFGPVALFFDFSNEDEMLDLANDTEFGLGGAVWTKNIEKAEKIARYLDVGTVAINGGVRSEPALPFGGFKKSGYGRELAKLGIKEFTNMKTINIF